MANDKKFAASFVLGLVLLAAGQCHRGSRPRWRWGGAES